jgi:hypothetical protein
MTLVVVCMNRQQNERNPAQRQNTKYDITSHENFKSNTIRQTNKKQAQKQFFLTRRVDLT